MKNRPFFSLSQAIIKENFKMFWYLPVLSFIAYFMSGIFPLIMNPQYLTDPNRWYLEDCLMNWNIVFVCLLIAAPLVGSIVMMNYLHNPARAMTIHAQPFSRNKIFWSHTLTGWLMCILPPAAMTLIYLMISGQPGHSLQFGATSLAIITFFYGIFVLAGVLVGTSVMHVLLCGIFFGIVPLVLWLTWAYCENFLVGFWNMPDWMENFLFDTNPIFYQISVSGDWFGAGRILAYLAVGLCVLVFAALLAGRARLEHVGDSMLFRAAEEIITWLVVFVGMSCFGFFFYIYLDSRTSMLIGMAFGTLLAFVVVKIVLNRTIKIITRQNLLSLGAFALIAVIFAGCTMYDLTGFTRKVPDASKVVSVVRTDFGYGDTFEYWYDYIEESQTAHQDTLTSPEAIEKVIAVHQYIVDNKLYDYGPVTESAAVYDTDGNEVHQGNFWLTFRYTLDNGREMTRRFDFQLNQEVADLMNAVVTDAEYKDDGALLDVFTVENINYIELSVNDYSFEYAQKFQTGSYSDLEYDQAARNAQANLVLKDAADIEAFLKAMEEDHYSRTYTVKNPGTVDMVEDMVEDMVDSPEPETAEELTRSAVSPQAAAAPAADFNPWDYMDVNGTIYLLPGTEGVEEQHEKTAPEGGSKPVGKAHFTVRKGHNETLSFIEDLLREEGYDSHADHIAQR